MKRVLLLAGVGLMLAACSQTASDSGPLPITAASVLKASQMACSALPTAEQLAAAVDATSKTVTSVKVVAEILCAAIAPPPVLAPVTVVAPATPAPPS